MTALQWITKEAKALRRKFPKRFATWREYVAQASAVYAKKHKRKSPVGKKKTVKKAAKKSVRRVVKKSAPRRKVGAVTTRSKSHTDKNKITANIQVGKIGDIDRLKQSIKTKEHLANTLRTYKTAKPKLRDAHDKMMIRSLPQLIKIENKIISELKKKIK